MSARFRNVYIRRVFPLSSLSSVVNHFVILALELTSSSIEHTVYFTAALLVLEYNKAVQNHNLYIAKLCAVGLFLRRNCRILVR